jgi:Ras GTPase-activating-like protein IQGAP2/3
MYLNIAVQYIRPKQIFYIRETLQKIILDIVGSDDLDLEVDPTIVSWFIMDCSISLYHDHYHD